MIKIMDLYFDNPNEIYCLKDISIKIKLAHTSVKNNLNNLIKLNLISEIIEKRGKRKFPFYKANVDFDLFKKYKIIYNISKILNSKLIDFLNDNLMPKSIILFGSFQHGEDLVNSDIDLFIECKSNNIDLKIFEKKLNRKIQLHFNKKFNNYSKELKNNIINGIVLSGYLEVFN